MGCCRYPRCEYFFAELNKAYVVVTATVVGLLQFSCGLVSIVCGCLLLNYGNNVKGESPWRHGAPIWCGAVGMVAGLFYVLTGMQAMSPKARRMMFYFSYGMTIATLSCCCASFHVLRKMHKCSGNSTSLACIPDADKLAEMAIVCMVMFAVLIASFIPVIVIYCLVPHRALKLQDADAGKGEDHKAYDNKGCI